jgi:haloacetate dehalogenase
VNLPLLPAEPNPDTTSRLFPGFASTSIVTDGATIRVLTGGSGPPLLLLHGHPQTHVIWHKLACELAKEFSVVIPDLRGYGDSGKPPGGARHVNYSFRAMALDQIQTMHHLGHDNFFVAGHDRGARVAHRLCLDHPSHVRKACLMDIAPTLTMYDDTNQAFATKYVWWFLQIQPFPLPEYLIGLDPAFYLQHHINVQCKTAGAIAGEALHEYLRCYCCQGTIHAVCEDYRAAADIDLEMDREDEAAVRKVIAPLLILWGAKGVVGQLWDVLATWRAKAVEVSGRSLPCGHFLPEEQPQEVLAELQRFFAT